MATECLDERTVRGIDSRRLLSALDAFKKGDFFVRLDFGYDGLSAKVADAFNEVLDLNDRFVSELERVSQMVGKAGKLTQRASLGDVGGSWAHAIASVNTLISNRVHPRVETSRVIGAVAKGDLSQKMALEINKRPLQGEFLRTAKTVNRMVNQLGSFAFEVTRVAREVGTDGTLGGQAKVKGVAGTWKDLTDNVNLMAGNLTGQVRNIAAVTTPAANGDLRTFTADEEEQNLQLLKENRFDCIVCDLHSPAGGVDHLVDYVGCNAKLRDVPLILYSEESLLLDEAMTDRLTRSRSVRHVQSPERLLDEVSLLLHLPVANIEKHQQAMLEWLHEDDAIFNGRRILIVDDDIRNIFALTSVLERYNMHILSAETGRDAIQILHDTPDVDVVLMDIMMPEFDGLDTTRAIREIPRFKELPIIAVTAKAMKGDREKCIEAGAWDYLSKPVNPEQMLAVLRAWIRAPAPAAEVVSREKSEMVSSET